MKVVLVGGGPSNLFLATKLLENGHTVELYEKTTAPGKKFLVAGKSGLNITHSENIDLMSDKYFEHKNLFLSLFKDFSNQDLVTWLESIGVKTFIGSSKRIFPESFKAAEILNIWLDILKPNSKFSLFTKHELTSIEKKYVIFNDSLKVEFDKIVYSLGGSSWARTGSDGTWTKLFEQYGIKINPFKPMNCGFNIDWSDNFIKIFDRSYLKNIKLNHDVNSTRGELMVTPYGIEGTPIYTLSRGLRSFLEKSEDVYIYIDLKPDLSEDEVNLKFKNKKSKESLSTFLKKTLSLDKLSIALLKEFTTKDEYSNNIQSLIKKCPIKVSSTRPIEEAISTSGGISMNEVDEMFMLIKMPNHYAIGEMLDWDTITGGYLLQGCFSMAYRVSGLQNM
jgi:uncharacterized flavoprotein (TIGR03862 family)